MELEVDGIAGHLCTVTIAEEWTVRNLKEAIELQSGIPADQQRLVLGYHELQDAQALDLGAGRVKLLRRTLEEVKFLQRLGTCAAERAPTLLRAAPAALRAEREVVLRAVQKSGLALQFAAQELRGDKEVVLAAVSQCGHALQHATEALQSDKDVVVAAARSSEAAWTLLPSQCFAEKDVMLALIGVSGRHLQLADPSLRRDPEVVMAAVRRDVFSLQAAADDLRGQEDFMIEAICEEPMAFLFAAEKLQQDRDFVVRAVKQNMRVLRYVGKLQKDPVVMSAATNSFGSAMHLAWEDEEALGTGIVA